jgi:aminoglycoside phosphotransferase (APT) family kinase protein
MDLAPSDTDLRRALEQALPPAAPRPAEIRRRQSAYRTSFPLEELDVTQEGGSELRLVFKDIYWRRLDEDARIAKPDFLHDPRREPAVYARVLEHGPAGPPRLHGFAEPEPERSWLFLERVRGLELYQVGDRSLWEAAALWLGRMHAELAPGLERHASSGRLLAHDAAFHRRWMERALAFAEKGGDPARIGAVQSLAESHAMVVEALERQPRTVIHGEFYASNVLVDADRTPPRVAPVDWELAAAGPGLTDLAALASGGWRDEDRAAFLAAYAAGAGGIAGEAGPRDLDLARLQLAIQWLGWAPSDWTPPAGHRHDWLAEANGLAERLGLR